MKKLICLLLAAILALSCFSGCARMPDVPTDEGKKPTDATAAYPTEPENQIDFFDAFYSICASGINGQGYIWDLGYSIDYIDYDKENSDITDFLKAVKVNLQQNGKDVDRHTETWSNGDTLTVTLSYSKSAAEELGLTLKETSKDFVIYGLLEANDPPATEAEIDVPALISTLTRELPAKDQVTAAYFCYTQNRELTKYEGLNGYVFPAGYDYAQELVYDDSVRYLYAVSFIVFDGEAYYLCHAGVNPDGTQCGSFFIASRRFTTEAEALEKLTNNWGANNVIKASGV